MAKVQSVDRKASLLFVGDVNVIMRSGLGLLRRISTVGQHVTLPDHWVASRCLRSLLTLME